MTPQHEILAFVRGQREIADLAALGIKVDAEGDNLVVSNPEAHVAVAVPADIAEGMMALAEDGDRLRSWASVLLAAAPFIELALDEAPYGDVLLEALWDASNGEPIRAAALLAARELRVT